MTDTEASEQKKGAGGAGLLRGRDGGKGKKVGDGLRRP